MTACVNAVFSIRVCVVYLTPPIQVPHILEIANGELFGEGYNFVPGKEDEVVREGTARLYRQLYRWIVSSL
ncbi:hypothetical protein AB0758_30660 [Tolypothrix bouteillei VB521301_2]|uniref:hypothetical protein n=1 Tax=Tolypothrix bouteillei TaxID=1246981 RepID=UPI0038B46F9B